MKAKIFGFLAVGLATMALASCSDYLDLTPTTKLTDKAVWSNADNATSVVNTFYENIYQLGQYNDEGQYLAGLTEALTDEFKYGSTNYNARCYIPSESSYGGSTLTVNYVDVYYGKWGSLYYDIRLVNGAMSKMNEFGGSLDANVKTQLTAELRFFRGMFYFELVKRYKDVILYDEDMTKIVKDKAVSTEAECWEFVYQDLKFAAENLAVSTVPNGRITSGAAYGLLSRAMLYAKRWSDAKAAAEKVIAMGYTMPTDLKAAWTDGGAEAILQYSFSTNGVYHSFDNMYAPLGDKALDGDDQTPGQGTPTQEMVESFELKTGGLPDWTPWHTTAGTTETPPYAQLEPRFANTILKNGDTWKGRKIQTYSGGTDQACTWMDDPIPDGRTVTGYYLRKLVNENHSFKADTKCTAPWTAIRMAEIWLNYAEACYMTGDKTDAIKGLKAVRDRVGLPTDDTLQGDDLMAAIRHERKVELAYEGQYYWDMRRWGLAETAFSNYRVHGMKVTHIDGDTYRYNYIECDKQDRHFPSKMYRFPMPTDEISNNSQVTQYPEWN
ncbi:MAG: RagB/SusD family nutrient uptake outer membrane protein [Muribaculaceae bacterium]|jgi:starch-binding outer membrane protein, SusD/RagB family|nr:RagB/SusD family nutrient uptake outer membrane protein [Muribaculaceae bacterium]